MSYTHLAKHECIYLDYPPTYTEFLQSYLIPNRPVIIGRALVSTWPAIDKWIDEESGIDWDYLSKEYGACEVTTADCGTRDFSDQKRETRPFRDVVDLWKAGHGQSLYVKDWHLARTVEKSAVTEGDNLQTHFYTTPDIFRDDWMNAYYCANTTDDFQFVYVGAAGTFTPLHRDVYTSYSWSTNICGRKRWWLFSPEQTALLFRAGKQDTADTVYDVRDVDHNVFTEFQRANPIIVEQKEGETIFVPSGWYHQVENLTACISINHNWCNSVNLPSLYASMCAKVVEVEYALSDVKELLETHSTAETNWWREWVTIVQDVVEKDAGWNWLTFWRMVKHAMVEATTNPNPSSHDMHILWTPAPQALRPPYPFVKMRVTRCYEDFLTRDRHEIDSVDGLDDVMDAIGKLLFENKI